MIKKFVSNALLSVVMDKKARDKLQAVQDAKKRQAEPPAQEPAAEPEPSAPKQTAAAKSEFEARADRYGAMLAGARPPTGGEVDEDPADLVRQALESAEAELLGQKQNRKPMTTERRALIDQAMAIHRSNPTFSTILMKSRGRNSMSWPWKP